jgi:hypothetical protein
MANWVRTGVADGRYIKLSVATATLPNGQPRLIIKLPGRYMNDATHLPDSHTTDEDADSTNDRPVYDVSRVPDYPTGSLRSGRTRNEPGGGDCNVAFSAGVDNSSTSRQGSGSPPF